MVDSKKLDDCALDTVFRNARSYNGWQSKPVADDVIYQIYDLMKWGATSANSCPLRIVFVKTEAAKERLKPLLDKGNQEKTMQAPIVALFAVDYKFYFNAHKLAPHIDVEKWYVGKDQANRETASLNGMLQAAYFMLAARSHGLDCGPMSGVNKEAVKEAFFPDLDGEVKFICALGYGAPESLYPRAERLEFDEAAKFV